MIVIKTIVTTFNEEASTLIGETHMLTANLDIAEQNLLRLQSKFYISEKEKDWQKEKTNIFYFISLS